MEFESSTAMKDRLVKKWRYQRLRTVSKRDINLTITGK